MGSAFSATRRLFVAGAGAAAAAPAWLDAARAGDDTLEAALQAVLKGAVPRAGGVAIAAPDLAESGHSVPVAVEVAAGAIRARAVHVFLEHGPYFYAGRFGFGGHRGKAAVATRLRMFSGQTVIALAEMEDGSFRIGRRAVTVTVGACYEER